MHTRISLTYTPPFYYKNTLFFLSLYAIQGIETVGPNTYERFFDWNGSLGFLRVTFHPHKPELTLDIYGEKNTDPIVQHVYRMFDLESPFKEYHAHFLNYSKFSLLWQRHQGVRMVKGWNLFETAIQTILGQCVSLKHAKNLTYQLVQLFGKAVYNPYTQSQGYLFPTPEILSHADLIPLKTTQARKKTILEVSNYFSRPFNNKTINTVKEELLSLPGMGPWSVESIALRGFGHVDSFPKNDLILKRMLLKYHLNSETFKPWRSYAAMVLWHESLQNNVL